MRSRTLVAVAILLAWAGALGWHLRREYFGPAGERLAEAALTLPPGVAYYALFRGETRAGWGQRELDTLPGGAGFLLRERFETELPGVGEAGRAEIRGEATLDARLGLRDFVHVTASPRGRTTVEGSMEGDSVLEVTVRRPGSDETRRIPADGGLLLPAAWPLRVAAAGEARSGERFAVRLLDPAAAEARRTELRVLERATRTFPDSADLDSLTNRWFVAHLDTVTAWRVAIGDAAGGGATTWVDEDGRVIEGELAGGLRAERTAFELAFYLRPGATPPGGAPGVAEDGSPEAPEEASPQAPGDASPGRAP